MAQPSQSASAEQIIDPRRWIALATLLMASFMNLIDVTIVNVALPSLQRNLGANSSQIEWMLAGFVLAFALSLLPFGRLGDILGKKTIFLVGVALFTLMSVVCGISPNIELLIVARVLQGVAGGIMTPQVLSIIQNIFPAHERGTAFAMFGVTAGLAAVAGPVTGGFLISLDLFGLDWRPIFLINLPIGMIAIVLGIRNIPNLKGNPSLSNDWIGIGIATLASFLLIFPLIEGRTFDWPFWVFAMMAMAIPSLWGFVAWQKHQERHNRPQLLPMILLRNRNYMLGTLASTAFFSGIPGFFMVVALLFQTGYGLTPLQSGTTTIPFPVGVFIASAIAGKLGPRYLKPRLFAGVLVLFIGMFMVREAVINIDGTLDRLAFALPLLVSGFGMGIAISVLFQMALAEVPRNEAGSGSGGLQAFQQLGGAIGVAVIGQIFFSILSSGSEAMPIRFVTAASSAMIYNLSAFALVAVVALFLKAGPSTPVAKSQPVHVEL